MGNINIIKELKDIYGENLVSIISYGENIEQGILKKESNQNILVILGELEASHLKDALPFIKKWRKTKKPLPIFMSESEWLSSTDIYPIEYIEIKNNYEILYGKNVVKPVRVSKPDLRLKSEYELKNILVRIREIYLGNSDNHKFMVEALEKTSTNLIRVLKSTLNIFDIQAPEDYSEVIQKMSELTEFDGGVFVEVLSAKENKRKLSPDKLENLVGRAINSIDSLYKFINDLEI